MKMKTTIGQILKWFNLKPEGYVVKQEGLNLIILEGEENKELGWVRLDLDHKVECHPFIVYKQYIPQEFTDSSYQIKTCANLLDLKLEIVQSLYYKLEPITDFKVLFEGKPLNYLIGELLDNETVKVYHNISDKLHEDSLPDASSVQFVEIDLFIVKDSNWIELGYFRTKKEVAQFLKEQLGELPEHRRLVEVSTYRASKEGLEYSFGIVCENEVTGERCTYSKGGFDNLRKMISTKWSVEWQKEVPIIFATESMG